MKLEPKHLAGYLPYELKIQGQTHGDIETLFGIKGQTVFVESSKILSTAWADIWEIKPILRPLSDLAKEIEYGGKKFVPIEITRYAYPSEAMGLNPSTWSYRVIQTLLEWHFDVYGLIENNLAIDINKLN